jgi:hypothetical protein
MYRICIIGVVLCALFISTDSFTQTRIIVDREKQETCNVYRVIEELKRAIRHQCDWCLESILAEGPGGKARLDTVLVLFGDLQAAPERPSYVPNTSTWDFDFTVEDLRFTSGETADATLNCIFYRNLIPTKYVTDAGRRITVHITLERKNSIWKITDISNLISFLSAEAYGRIEKELGEREIEHLPPFK